MNENTGRLSPTELRIEREHLGVSRAALAAATALSSSVIWRAEQDSAKPVTDEQYLEIERVLDKWTHEGVPAEYAKQTKVAAHAGTATDDKLVTELTQKAFAYATFVESLRQRIEAEIANRKAKKAGTKDLTALLTSIEQFVAEQTN